MITPFMIYVLTRLDQIREICSYMGFLGWLCTLLLGTVAGTCWLIANCEGYEYSGKLSAQTIESLMSACRISVRWLKWSVAAILVSVSIKLFVPTMKECCAIVVVPAICNNENVKAIGNEFYEVALEWMKELRPENVRKNLAKEPVQDGEPKKKK